ncbi:putative protein N(5)-glutamine methyltransferase [Nocardiopsis sp. RSe5-2]|uniref:peptide chain release factor N(5)-glutamine methyltransferase n=1 Tax=Nocardiopsis endophytica TaxID=3018445 RepID=A0ABT4UDR3_9ACTN|nr:putative protein N(5)-glutamine methyltransferase [Nocardiopsis endophytica]MDA2815111.1 putative protein N(5)-glutamine methyltransferase [Nocardiopsis endophytica]
MFVSPTLPSPVVADAVRRLRAAGCVFAEDEADLLARAAAGPRDLSRLVDRRCDGIPLEHLLGWAEFTGLRIAVGPGVFVPRPRSMFLVERAAAHAPRSSPSSPPPVVVDLCCGAGGIGAAVASLLPGAELHAADSDPVAVDYARRNISPSRGRAHTGDLYSALPRGLRGRVDLLVVNAPYVPSAEIALLPPEARLHEPLPTLDGGPDGVDVQRRVAAGAPAWLAPGGHLLIETSGRQAETTAAAVSGAGLEAVVESCEEWDCTVVVGTAPGGPQVTTSDG